mmetsp:Transcript_6008/g.19251  ORF Transcript_6008/g.19251 Transcript_6008/m.19251 type:complete len:247 (-) Transcript_6008:1017-1757(-)
MAGRPHARPHAHTPLSAGNVRHRPGATSLGARASGNGAGRLDERHGPRHPAGGTQPLRAAGRGLAEEPGSQGLAQRIADLRAVGRRRLRLQALRGRRARHLQAHAQVCGLLRVHDLVAKAGAHHDGGAHGKRLGEAVLAAVREEEVHTRHQHVDLGHHGHADGIGRRRQLPQRLGLRAQGDHQQRPLFGALRPEGVEGAAPGRPAELRARQPARPAVHAEQARAPAEVRAVARDDGAHAHEHDSAP